MNVSEIEKNAMAFESLLEFPLTGECEFNSSDCAELVCEKCLEKAIDVIPVNTNGAPTLGREYFRRNALNYSIVSQLLSSLLELPLLYALVARRINERTLVFPYHSQTFTRAVCVNSAPLVRAIGLNSIKDAVDAARATTESPHICLESLNELQSLVTEQYGDGIKPVNVLHGFTQSYQRFSMVGHSPIDYKHILYSTNPLATAFLLTCVDQKYLNSTTYLSYSCNSNLYHQPRWEDISFIYAHFFAEKKFDHIRALLNCPKFVSLSTGLVFERKITLNCQEAIDTLVQHIEVFGRESLDTIHDTIIESALEIDGACCARLYEKLPSRKWARYAITLHESIGEFICEHSVPVQLLKRALLYGRRNIMTELFNIYKEFPMVDLSHNIPSIFCDGEVSFQCYTILIENNYACKEIFKEIIESIFSFSWDVPLTLNRTLQLYSSKFGKSFYTMLEKTPMICGDALNIVDEYLGPERVLPTTWWTNALDKPEVLSLYICRGYPLPFNQYIDLSEEYYFNHAVEQLNKYMTNFHTSFPCDAIDCLMRKENCHTLAQILVKEYNFKAQDPQKTLFYMFNQEHKSLASSLIDQVIDKRARK